jgi:hypothetical protein
LLIGAYPTYFNIQCVPLIVSPVTETLAYRRPASSGTSRDSYRSQGHDKRTLSVIECDATTITVYKFNSAPFETAERNSENASGVRFCVHSRSLIIAGYSCPILTLHFCRSVHGQT